jgi:hypothetical protein
VSRSRKVPALGRNEPPSSRSSVIVEELCARSRELGIRVALLAPQEVRLTVVGDPRATKVRVAHALVAQGFRELADRVPRIPKRAALGIAPRDRYWLHVFDALAVAVAARGGDDATGEKPSSGRTLASRRSARE